MATPAKRRFYLRFLITIIVKNYHIRKANLQTSLSTRVLFYSTLSWGSHRLRRAGQFRASRN